MFRFTTILCMLFCSQVTLAAAPAVSNMSIAANFDTPVEITLTGVDNDRNERLNFSYTAPANGTLTRKSATNKTLVVTYTPTSGFAGTDTFTYTARDRTKNTSSRATVTITVTAPEVSNLPVPFGFWGMNGYVSSSGLTDVSARFNTTIFQTASSAPHYTATSLLPLVRSVGMQITLRMTSSNASLTTNGEFDMQKWKDQITAWKTACDTNSADCIQSFIDDGTLAGHMLIDDIYNFSTVPSAEELDEMARYSQEIFPGLMTFVRNNASTMPKPASGQFAYLDACVNQYTNYQGYSDGKIEDYVVEQATAAQNLGLSVINGLNIANGGDGSSGVTGWSAGKHAMSAAEIAQYGTALLDRNAFPDLIMFLLWEYDGEELWSDGVSIGSDYFDQPELQEAIFNLGILAGE